MDPRTPDRRLFTAELQRLKAKGTTPAPAPMAAGSASDIMTAISALQADIRALSGFVRGEEQAEDVVAATTAAEEAETERGRAEVTMLKTELRALAVCIQQTKSEIAALRTSSSRDDRLMVVANELDAVVAATENATHGILEASEKIDTIAHQIRSQAGDSHMGHLAEEISDTVVAIFEHCNFQDISGQRITKVVKTLQYIEDRVNKMVDIWGAEAFEGLPTKEDKIPTDDSKLLNGPQLQAISQADIDAMFG